MPSGRFWVLLGSASGMNRSACAPGTSLGICVAVPSRISQSSRNCSCQNQPDLSPCFCEQQDSRASDCRPGHNCCRESCVCSASVFDDPESSMLLFDFGLRFWSAFLNSRTWLLRRRMRSATCLWRHDLLLIWRTSSATHTVRRDFRDGERARRDDARARRRPTSAWC